MLWQYKLKTQRLWEREREGKRQSRTHTKVDTKLEIETENTHTHPDTNRHTLGEIEREREWKCSPVKVGSPFVKPSRSQEDFLKWLWRQFRSKDLTSLSARQIWGRVITLKPLHTRWQWSPQLLCKCNVTLTDKQIIKEWKGWGWVKGPKRRRRRRRKKSPQLVEIRGGYIVYLMNSGDGQCQRNDD